MSKRSKQIALDEAEPDMVLAEDLLTPRGKVILPQGATLTAKTIESLHRYEVSSLRVELSDDVSAAEDAAEKERQLERITRLFRKSAEDKAATLLKQYVTQFRTEAE
ncbi:MAG: hypothetical protein HYS18_12800 [Burkholderiales bacterium]|nr:hypothetical protein [Burkholderiales bacterium]